MGFLGTGTSVQPVHSSCAGAGIVKAALVLKASA